VKLLDKIANVALILGVAAFLYIVVRGELTRPPTKDNLARALVGESISLPGLQLNQQRDSLLVAISTNCHFCKDSLPFYKELSARASGKLDVIAVLPQPLSESQAFLQRADVSATRVVSANLSLLGIRGTPTILLVDGHGKVQEEWQGFLDDHGRQQVISRVLR
jgi:hypothetical protein